jgi:putative NADPH-quinone reductase
MRALLVYCHPVPESFNAAVRDHVIEVLKANGHEVRLLDLYAEGFNPVMSADERRGYHTPGDNEGPVRAHLDHLFWCEMLVFVYPTWWYGLPAMLKGWLDRVFVPHATFEMPEKNKPIRSKLTHIKRVAAISTTGAPAWFLDYVIGNPGKKTILRGIRALCHSSCKTLWVSHDLMDSSTPESRAKFLKRIEKRLKGF